MFPTLTLAPGSSVKRIRSGLPAVLPALPEMSQISIFCAVLRIRETRRRFSAGSGIFSPKRSRISSRTSSQSSALATAAIFL